MSQQTLDTEGGPVTRSALGRCIAIPADRFADEYWGKKVLLTKAAELGDDFGDLMSVEAADELISERGLRTPFIRMAKEGTVLPSSAYTAPGGFGAEVADQVSSDKVLDAFANGSTIVLQGLHRMWPPLQDFTRRLIVELGHPAQVNAYITPASSQGFDPHYDVHDVFVLQISGQKRWVVHAPVHVDPLPDEPWADRREAVGARALEEPAVDTVLSPGDALYLPRGWLHSATALGGTTIHLTIGMPAFTRTDLARELVARAVRADSLRGSLPLGIDLGDAGQLATHLRAAAEGLIAELTATVGDDARTAAVASTLASRLTKMSRPEPVRPLATVDLLASLGATDRVRWRDALRATVRVEGDRVRILLADRTVALPVVAASAVLALHEGETVPAGSLPGLDEADGLTVVRRLLREGIVVPAS